MYSRKGVVRAAEQMTTWGGGQKSGVGGGAGCAGGHSPTSHTRAWGSAQHTMCCKAGRKRFPGQSVARHCQHGHICCLHGRRTVCHSLTHQEGKGQDLEHDLLEEEVVEGQGAVQEQGREESVEEETGWVDSQPDGKGIPQPVHGRGGG